jgi:hypothetical protein
MSDDTMPPNPPGKKLYTFRVHCAFEIQHTFAESEVEQDPDGGEGDFCPTDAAIKALEQELRDLIQQDHAVTAFAAYAASDELLDA